VLFLKKDIYFRQEKISAISHDVVKVIEVVDDSATKVVDISQDSSAANEEQLAAVEEIFYYLYFCFKYETTCFPADIPDKTAFSTREEDTCTCSRELKPSPQTMMGEVVPILRQGAWNSS